MKFSVLNLDTIYLTITLAIYIKKSNSYDWKSPLDSMDLNLSENHMNIHNEIDN